MKQNIIQEKTFKFSIAIVELYKHLVYNKKEFVIAKQLLRSGTSIGANVEEAIGGQSKKDFYTKICIAYKEARETDYWLRILEATNFIEKNDYANIAVNLLEILKILGSTKKTMESNKNE